MIVKMLLTIVFAGIVSVVIPGTTGAACAIAALLLGILVTVLTSSNSNYTA